MCNKCAEKVLKALENLEKAGYFKGLSPEEKELERHILGMRIRASLKCPEE